MVGTYLETVFMGKVYVLLVLAVYVVATFGSLEIYVSHLGVVAYSLPENVALVMAEVYAVYVATCVLALHLGMHPKGGYD